MLGLKFIHISKRAPNVIPHTKWVIIAPANIRETNGAMRQEGKVFCVFVSLLLSLLSLSGVPDYFDRNKISSGGDLSHYSSASLY